MTNPDFWQSENSVSGVCSEMVWSEMVNPEFWQCVRRWFI